MSLCQSWTILSRPGYAAAERAGWSGCFWCQPVVSSRIQFWSTCRQASASRYRRTASLWTHLGKNCWPNQVKATNWLIREFHSILQTNGAAPFFKSKQITSLWLCCSNRNIHIWTCVSKNSRDCWVMFRLPYSRFPIPNFVHAAVWWCNSCYSSKFKLYSSLLYAEARY